MAQPVVAIRQDANDPKRATVNLMPCRIHHNGQIGEDVDAFWSPTDGKDDTRTAYFRGRKLQGKTLQLPDTYRGIVAHRIPEEPKNKAVENGGSQDPISIDEEDESDIPTATMQVTEDFRDVVVWGHESVADAAEDPYVRAIEEWMHVANKIHSFDAEEKPQ